MRYYYTDPLEAAWMAKHFGMIFRGKHTPCKPTLGVYGDEPVWVVREQGISVKWDKFYIHPDSLHLLEPQVGDLGVCDNNRPCKYVPVYTPSPVCNDSAWVFDSEIESPPDPNDVKIIQRNDIAFMWPESEVI